MAERIILDVDTGTDDAVAILLAAFHPQIELVAVTTVCGSVPVEVATENSLRVLDLACARVPVFMGMTNPMVQGDIQTRLAGQPGRLQVHGNYLDIPPTASSAEPTRAVDYLIDSYMPNGQDCILVATGPLTNVAMALRLEPRLAAAIPEIIIMGGGHQHANTTSAAEFNIWADPEAAHVVLRSGLHRITLLPLDATHQAAISTDDCRHLRASGLRAACAAAGFIEERIRGYDEGQPMAQPHTAPVHDALCVATVADRSVIVTHPTFVDVELCGAITRGRTVMDVDRRSGLPPNADVAFDADARRFASMLLDALTNDS